MAAILGEEVLSGYGEAAITVCGGLMLVSAHLMNHSFCRSCVVQNCTHSCSTIGADGQEVRTASAAGETI
jgi:hypothetical protein